LKNEQNKILQTNNHKARQPFFGCRLLASYHHQLLLPNMGQMILDGSGLNIGLGPFFLARIRPPLEASGKSQIFQFFLFKSKISSGWVKKYPSQNWVSPLIPMRVRSMLGLGLVRAYL